MNQRQKDIFFMQKALEQAQKAFQAQEIPIGAVVVSPYEEILGSGYNQVESKCSQIYHAEACAIKNAGVRIKDWRLDGCTLYVTLEPCMMCISLISLSRIERLVFGARSPLFGYHLDKEGILAQYTKQIKNITEGIMADEAAILLQEFFKKKRK